MASLFRAGFEGKGDETARFGLDVLADHVIRTSIQYSVKDDKGVMTLKKSGEVSERRTIVQIDAGPGVSQPQPQSLVVAPAPWDQPDPNPHHTSTIPRPTSSANIAAILDVT